MSLLVRWLGKGRGGKIVCCVDSMHCGGDGDHKRSGQYAEEDDESVGDHIDEKARGLECLGAHDSQQ